MKFVARLAIHAVVLAIVDGVIYFTLTSNLCDGVYPTEADSIAIPLIESAILTVVAGVLLLFATAASGLQWLHRIAQTSPVRRNLVTALLALTHVAAALFVLWGLMWAVPAHYWIVASCMAAALLVLTLGMRDLARLRRGNAVTPIPLHAEA